MALPSPTARHRHDTGARRHMDTRRSCWPPPLRILRFGCRRKMARRPPMARRPLLGAVFLACLVCGAFRAWQTAFSRAPAHRRAPATPRRATDVATAEVGGAGQRGAARGHTHIVSGVRVQTLAPARFQCSGPGGGICTASVVADTTLQQRSRVLRVGSWPTVAELEPGSTFEIGVGGSGHVLVNPFLDVGLAFVRLSS